MPRLISSKELEAMIRKERIPAERADALRERHRELAALEEAKPVGYGRAIAQIPAQAFQDVAGLADVALRGASYLPGLAAGTVADRAAGRTPVGSQIANTLDLPGRLRERQKRLGYREPEGGPAALQRVGSAALTSAPFGAAGGLRSMLAEALSGATSQGAVEATGTVTDNPVLKTLAGIVGGLAPSAARAGGRAFAARRPGGEVRAYNAEAAARKMFDEQIPDSSRAEVVRRLANEVDPNTARARFGERMPPGVAGPPRPPTQAMPVQVMQDIAPATVSSARTVAKYSPAVINEAFELRRRNLEAIRAEWNRSFAGGIPEDLNKQYLRARASLDDDVRLAFAGHDPKGVAGLPLRHIVRARDVAQTEAGVAGVGLLPTKSYEALDRILEKSAAQGGGDTTTLNELWSLRKTVDQELADSFALLTAPQKERGRYLTQLKTSIDQTMKEAARAGGRDAEEILALRAGIATAKKRNVLFALTHMNRANPVARAFAQNSDAPEPIVDAIMKSPNPKRELRRLDLALGDNKDAREGLKTLVNEHIFGGKFSRFIDPDVDTLAESGRTIIDTARKNLRDSRKRAAFEHVHGPGSARNAERFLGRIERLQSTDIGTYGAAYRTGTGNLTEKELSDRIGVLQQVASGGLRSAAVKALGRVNISASDDEIKYLLGRAYVDPKIGVAFVRPMKPLEWRSWAVSVEQALARSARATAAGTREEPER